ncbi:hypothetical protein [Mycobacterium sp. MMS18-G62]
MSARTDLVNAIRSAVIAGSVLLLVACGSTGRPQAPLADDSDAAVSDAVESITTFPTQLDPRIWNGMAMKPDVRDAILRVVNRVTGESEIAGLTVDAVDLFGSNASYEYDDKSDVGVHVFVHKPGMSDEELTPSMHLLNDLVERRQEGRVLLYGLPLEVTFHAGRSANYQPRAGIGQYSVTDGRWVVEPVKQPDNFDRNQMKADAKKFIGKYNDLVRSYQAGKKGFDCTRFDALDREMSDYRNQGFEQGLGSRSTQNLTYRALRRLNVEIPEMVDTLADECIFINESVG